MPHEIPPVKIKEHIYVHIIESPTSDELLDGVTEGRTISSFLELANIPCCYNLVTNEATLSRAIHDRLVEAASRYDKIPIIHFSIHGCEDGIQLTNGTFITWHHLATLLSPLNNAFQGVLIVCLSACSGIAGSKMALTDNPLLPMNTLIATSGTPTWQEAAVAFVTFYHHVIVLNSAFDTAISAMKMASSHEHFVQIRGADVQENYRKFLALSRDNQQAVIESMRQSQSSL